MDNPKFRIIQIADTHFGSTVGLLPPAYGTSEGIIAQLNSVQQYLWECWLDFCARAKRFHPHAVIIVGDIVEGKQKKDGGAGLSLRLMVDQKESSIQAFKMLKANVPKNCQWFFVQGTKYHVGERGEAEEDVARALEARRYNSVGSGIYVREVLWLVVDNSVIIEYAHSIGGTSGLYQSTALDRETHWANIRGNDQSSGMPKIDMIVRAHVHNFLTLGGPRTQSMIIPCWQIQTQHARKKSVHRLMPNIGGVFTVVSPARKRKGEPPCDNVHHLYDLPPAPLTHL